MIIVLLGLFPLIIQGQIQEIQHELNRRPFIKDSVSLVNSLNQLGTLYRTRNADSCFYYGMEAKRIATNINYEKGQIDADHVIAFALFKKGIYAESLELMSKILPWYEQHNDYEKVIRLYLDMVEVGNKGVFDKPKIVSYLQKAIYTGEKLQKDSIMAEVYIYYCNRAPHLSTDSVRYYLQKSEEIASRYNDKNMLLFNLLWQVRLMALEDNNEEALPLAQKALAEAQKIGNAKLEYNAHVAMIAYYRDQPEKQLEYLHQQYEIVKNSGDQYLEIYILNSMVLVADSLGNKDEIINAYRELEKAWNVNDENTRKFINDYVNYNNIQNQNLQLIQNNKQRKLWLVVVSISSLLVVMVIYLTMLHRNRKAKSQIEFLNNTVNMQIVAMEEVKEEAKKQERQRLGQDLHDGLSASIASIRHQLEFISMDIEDTALKKRLKLLLTQVASAYEVARDKSHEWFSASEGKQEQSFEQSIRLIVNSALPDSQYLKEIHIDDGSLEHTSVDTRIELLRISQEAIANIIKHAKARKVGILIYEDNDHLILSVNDDGKGIDQNIIRKKSGLGLQSIRKRVQNLNGTTTIRSNSKGTEIIVSIPLKSD